MHNEKNSKLDQIHFALGGHVYGNVKTASQGKLYFSAFEIM